MHKAWMPVTIECVDGQRRELSALTWRVANSKVGRCEVQFGGTGSGTCRDFCLRSGVMLPVAGAEVIHVSKGHGAQNWRLTEESLRLVRERLGFTGHTQHWQWSQPVKPPPPRQPKPADPRQLGLFRSQS